ncbi:glycosyltransferase [Parasporobacterium paucivorans]|uniref:4,4'-diaponeurosporenoate glycosyltransferase n=1 Tax=Parasporobacterium paucivorans DSM 15970 TaxID=1122934 RepID=A0A1M6GK68_9FIRM|nr:glycosyltransferase [Parasporobacterium paucivorans]SHJ10344.1 4,4'-diaponeurosporenoate glycosyltransferase [Parasporobacterium paucivorans DSM 15970]
MKIDLIIIFTGLAAAILLFYRFPVIKKEAVTKEEMKLSVIIPARNEEDTLPLLLSDLRAQKVTAHEIICVDDNSTDATASRIESYGVRPQSLKGKPEHWIGKSWAAQAGADLAVGELLLFLDADVRMDENGLARLLQSYKSDPMVLSVQPYHKVIMGYENFSFFFNMIQTAANGLALPFRNRKSGLYGPIILIRKEDYYKVGGHESVRSDIIEDMAFAQQLRKKNIPYRLLLGDNGISYRMYGGGFKELCQGWIKNQASGALRTPLWLVLMVFIWISSSASVPIQLCRSVFEMDSFKFFVFSALYVLWVVIFWRISGYLGDFRKRTCIFYPVYLVFYIWIFLISVIKKTFHLKVTWKDREIRLEK